MNAKEKERIQRKDAKDFSVAHLEEVVIRSMLHKKTIMAVIDELIEQDPDDIGEEALFAGAIVLYVIIAYWIAKSASLKPLIITIIGNTTLIILYIIAESSLSESLLGIETEELSDFGITIKIFQIAMIVVLLISSRK